MPSCDLFKTPEIRQEGNDILAFLGESFVPNAYAYHLFKLDIAIVCNLDWRSQEARQNDREGIAIRIVDIKRTMRKAAAMLNLNRRGKYGVPYYFKLETSPAGEGHAHGVIAMESIGSPEVFIKTLKSLWHNIGDHPDIDLLDVTKGREWISYICKKEFEYGFEVDSPEIISPAMMRLMTSTQPKVESRLFLPLDVTEDKNLGDYL